MQNWGDRCMAVLKVRLTRVKGLYRRWHVLAPHGSWPETETCCGGGVIVCSIRAIIRTQYLGVGWGHALKVGQRCKNNCATDSTGRRPPFRSATAQRQ